MEAIFSDFACGRDGCKCHFGSHTSDFREESLIEVFEDGVVGVILVADLDER